MGIKSKRWRGPRELGDLGRVARAERNTKTMAGQVDVWTEEPSTPARSRSQAMPWAGRCRRPVQARKAQAAEM